MVEHGKKCCRLAGTGSKAASKAALGKAPDQQQEGQDDSGGTVVLPPPALASFAMQVPAVQQGPAVQERQSVRGRAAKRQRTGGDVNDAAPVVMETAQELGSLPAIKQEGVGIKQECDEQTVVAPGPVLPAEEDTAMTTGPGQVTDGADTLVQRGSSRGSKQQCPLQVFYTGRWTEAATLTPGQPDKVEGGVKPEW
jgi:hypothetical protein